MLPVTTISAVFRAGFSQIGWGWHKWDGWGEEQVCPTGGWKRSTEQQGGNQTWKLWKANKLTSCLPCEKSFAAYGEKWYFWATAHLREGWRVACSEGNTTVPVAASVQGKPDSCWSVLCPLVHNCLDYPFPSVCLRVTDRCTTWYLLAFCFGAKFCYRVFSVLKCNRGHHLLAKDRLFSAVLHTGGWAKCRVAFQELLSTSALQQHVLK